MAFWSLGAIVAVAWLRYRVPASGLERVSVKVRGAVWIPLSRIGTAIVSVVTPGANVSVPLVAV